MHVIVMVFQANYEGGVGELPLGLRTLSFWCFRRNQQLQFASCHWMPVGFDRSLVCVYGNIDRMGTAIAINFRDSIVVSVPKIIQ